MRQLAKITIKDREIDCILGVGNPERSKKQRVIVSADIVFDAGRAIKTDAIDDTINYSSLSKKIIQAVSTSQCYLFESLASLILSICLEDNRVLQATVRVTKPLKGSMIEMTRERGES